MTFEATPCAEVHVFNVTSLCRAQDLHLGPSGQVSVEPHLVTLTATRRGIPPFAGLSSALLMSRCLSPSHVATSQDLEGSGWAYCSGPRAGGEHGPSEPPAPQTAKPIHDAERRLTMSGVIAGASPVPPLPERLHWLALVHWW